MVIVMGHINGITAALYATGIQINIAIWWNPQLFTQLTNSRSTRSIASIETPEDLKKIEPLLKDIDPEFNANLAWSELSALSAEFHARVPKKNKTDELKDIHAYENEFNRASVKYFGQFTGKAIVWSVANNK